MLKPHGIENQGRRGTAASCPRQARDAPALLAPPSFPQSRGIAQEDGATAAPGSALPQTRLHPWESLPTLGTGAKAGGGSAPPCA